MAGGLTGANRHVKFKKTEIGGIDLALNSL